MKEWEKELEIYRLTPAPPKENNLQRYILNYLAEKDDKYIAWFLHYYEKTINDKAFSIVQDYLVLYNRFQGWFNIKHFRIYSIKYFASRLSSEQGLSNKYPWKISGCKPDKTINSDLFSTPSKHTFNEFDFANSITLCMRL